MRRTPTTSPTRPFSSGKSPSSATRSYNHASSSSNSSSSNSSNVISKAALEQHTAKIVSLFRRLIDFAGCYLSSTLHGRIHGMRESNDESVVTEEERNALTHLRKLLAVPSGKYWPEFLTVAINVTADASQRDSIKVVAQLLYLEAASVYPTSGGSGSAESMSSGSSSSNNVPSPPARFSFTTPSRTLPSSSAASATTVPNSSSSSSNNNNSSNNSNSSKVMQSFLRVGGLNLLTQLLNPHYVEYDAALYHTVLFCKHIACYASVGERSMLLSSDVCLYLVKMLNLDIQRVLSPGVDMTVVCLEELLLQSKSLCSSLREDTCVLLFQLLQQLREVSCAAVYSELARHNETVQAYRSAQQWLQPQGHTAGASLDAILEDEDQFQPHSHLPESLSEFRYQWNSMTMRCWRLLVYTVPHNLAATRCLIDVDLCEWLLADMQLAIQQQQQQLHSSSPSSPLSFHQLVPLCEVVEPYARLVYSCTNYVELRVTLLSHQVLDLLQLLLQYYVRVLEGSRAQEPAQHATDEYLDSDMELEDMVELWHLIARLTLSSLHNLTLVKPLRLEVVSFGTTPQLINHLCHLFSPQATPFVERSEHVNACLFHLTGLIANISVDAEASQALFSLHPQLLSYIAAFSVEFGEEKDATTAATTTATTTAATIATATASTGEGEQSVVEREEYHGATTITITTPDSSPYGTNRPMSVHSKLQRPKSSISHRSYGAISHFSNITRSSSGSTTRTEAARSHASHSISSHCAWILTNIALSQNQSAADAEDQIVIPVEAFSALLQLIFTSQLEFQRRTLLALRKISLRMYDDSYHSVLNPTSLLTFSENTTVVACLQLQLQAGTRSPFITNLPEYFDIVSIISSTTIRTSITSLLTYIRSLHTSNPKDADTKVSGLLILLAMLSASSTLYRKKVTKDSLVHSAMSKQQLDSQLFAFTLEYVNEFINSPYGDDSSSFVSSMTLTDLDLEEFYSVCVHIMLVAELVMIPDDQVQLQYIEKGILQFFALVDRYLVRYKLVRKVETRQVSVRVTERKNTALLVRLGLLPLVASISRVDDSIVRLYSLLVLSLLCSNIRIQKELFRSVDRVLPHIAAAAGDTEVLVRSLASDLLLTLSISSNTERQQLVAAGTVATVLQGCALHECFCNRLFLQILDTDTAAAPSALHYSPLHTVLYLSLCLSNTSIIGALASSSIEIFVSANGFVHLRHWFLLVSSSFSGRLHPPESTSTSATQSASNGDNDDDSDDDDDDVSVFLRQLMNKLSSNVFAIASQLALQPATAQLLLEHLGTPLIVAALPHSAAQITRDERSLRMYRNIAWLLSCLTAYENCASQLLHHGVLAYYPTLFHAKDVDVQRSLFQSMLNLCSHDKLLAEELQQFHALLIVLIQAIGSFSRRYGVDAPLDDDDDTEYAAAVTATHDNTDTTPAVQLVLPDSDTLAYDSGVVDLFRVIISCLYLLTGSRPEYAGQLLTTALEHDLVRVRRLDTAESTRHRIEQVLGRLASASNTLARSRSISEHSHT